MSNSLRSPTPTAICYVSGTFLSLLFSTSSPSVLAHAGHGNEFHQNSQASETTPISVDPETAKRLSIKVEPVHRQRLSIGIKTTGQIETLPNQKVEVTTPIPEAKVVELLVEPGASVKKGQPLAVVTSPDLVTLRVESQEKLAQAQADLQQAQADLKLAQQNYQRYQQIATAEIIQAQSQVNFAQQKYTKDKQLADDGALPRRNALESQTQLAQAQAELTKAKSRREVIAAENQLKRAQAAVELAKSNISRSNHIYQNRLAQLGTFANAKGLVTITAPITGKVADREVTLGQTFNDAGGKLLTIVNDNQVLATANIYEKDLSKVRIGQRIILKVTHLPENTFSGSISRIGTAVAGETRVIPVQAKVNNYNAQLKPGMFAQLEVLTNQTSAPILVIPTSAVVDANGKKLVYLQNGNVFQAIEITLGQTSGDMVEVKSGLFAGDMIVTQRAPQLYAQSLRGGSKTTEDKNTGDTQKQITQTTANLPTSLLLLGVGGIVFVGVVAFAAGSFWSSRRSRYFLSVGNPQYDDFTYETETHIDNHKQSNTSHSVPVSEQSDHHI